MMYQDRPVDFGTPLQGNSLSHDCTSDMIFIVNKEGSDTTPMYIYYLTDLMCREQCAKCVAVMFREQCRKGNLDLQSTPDRIEQVLREEYRLFKKTHDGFEDVGMDVLFEKVGSFEVKPYECDSFAITAYQLLDREPQRWRVRQVYQEVYDTEDAVEIRVRLARDDRGSLQGWMWEEQTWNFTPEGDHFEDSFFRFVDGEVTGPRELVFGIEFEISTSLTTAELQDIVTTVEPVSEPWFYTKYDSSVEGRYDRCYEIVTFPMSPRRQRMEWRRLFQKLDMLARAKGKAIGDFVDRDAVLSNGIHIHVNKHAFNEGCFHRQKFMSTWNLTSPSAQTLLNTVAKRPFGFRDNHFCRPHPEYRDASTRRKLRRVRVDGRETRYSTCRVTHETIEVRAFQGIFNLDHLLNCIEFTSAMFQFTSECSLRTISGRFAREFKSWLKSTPNYRRIKKELL